MRADPYLSVDHRYLVAEQASTFGPESVAVMIRGTGTHDAAGTCPDPPTTGFWPGWPMVSDPMILAAH